MRVRRGDGKATWSNHREPEHGTDHQESARRAPRADDATAGLS